MKVRNCSEHHNKHKLSITAQGGGMHDTCGCEKEAFLYNEISYLCTARKQVHEWILYGNAQQAGVCCF